jgi:hypothetical protein
MVYLKWLYQRRCITQTMYSIKRHFHIIFIDGSKTHKKLNKNKINHWYLKNLYQFITKLNKKINNFI